jgi:hypothetical protein
MATES